MAVASSTYRPEIYPVIWLQNPDYPDGMNPIAAIILAIVRLHLKGIAPVASLQSRAGSLPLHLRLVLKIRRESAT